MGRTHRKRDLIELPRASKINQCGNAQFFGFRLPNRGHRTVANHIQANLEFGLYASDRCEQQRECLERNKPADEQQAKRRELWRRPRSCLELAQVNAILKHRKATRA